VQARQAELRVLHVKQADVASVAKEGANLAGLVVVIHVRVPATQVQLASADSTSAALRIVHLLQLLVGEVVRPQAVAGTLLLLILRLLSVCSRDRIRLLSVPCDPGYLISLSSNGVLMRHV
jgi:hypothetical protein